MRDEPRDNGNGHDSHSPSWPTSNTPTPYEIFDQAKSAPYSKKTFYELVKLYHPDRHHHTSHLHGTISHTAKLERYRLVVAANDILSDPAKRRAYDLYGSGWGGKDDMHNNYREADKAWRSRPGSAAYNGTWEDWERWYEQQRADGKKQDPLYMSNGMFVASIVMFVLIGGWGQASRAGSHGMHLIEMQEKKDSHIGEDMWKRKKEKAYLTREGRVENFLRQREGWAQSPVNDSHMPR
ncbi:J domain-containing protein 1 [Cytospora mali]|uniref:J domain-containing protein 1 n=1 Tax=Cytospora mali TaxID=578113 RepID=A0A194VPL2_CYTMA|nr:J domain-containing protein 1 [Valsa mali]